jgi:hypothetical protein
MHALSLVPSTAPTEAIFASAQRPHLVRFYGLDDGAVEVVIATVSLAAAIQIASERLNDTDACVAQVVRDEQTGDISLLADGSFLLAVISPSELLQPAIDRDVRQACVELERGDLSHLASLFAPGRVPALA